MSHIVNGRVQLVSEVDAQILRIRPKHFQALSLTMHRCLAVEDIVELFVHLFCAPQLTQADSLDVRRGLVALARTSRIFYEPAMNALWKTLDAEELICVFGESIPVAETSALAHSRTLNTEKPWEKKAISDEQGLVLSRHAHRVRRLDLRMELAPGSFLPLLLGMSDYFRRTAARRGAPPFPNLRDLKCNFYNKQMVLGCIPILAGHTLRTLSFCKFYTLNHTRDMLESDKSKFHADEVVCLRSLLSPLHATFPSVSTLHYPDVMDDFLPSSFPQGAHQLRNLYGTPEVSIAVAIELARLPHLQDLSIRLRDFAGIGDLDDPTIVRPLQPEEVAFPSLSHLSVHVTSAAKWVSLSQITPLNRLSRLTRLSLYYNFWDPHESLDFSDDAEAIFVVIGHCVQLRELALTIYGPSNLSHPSLNNPFKPLYPLKNLENLGLEYTDIQLDNINLQELGKIWPRLVSLNIRCLSCKLPGIERRKFTFSEVLYLGQACPTLIDVSLDMEDFLPDPALTSLLQSGEMAPAPAIRYLLLRIPSSPLPQDYCKIVQFLQSAFPSLQAVYNYIARLFGASSSDLAVLIMKLHRKRILFTPANSPGEWTHVDDLLRRLRNGETVDFSVFTSTDTSDTANHGPEVLSALELEFEFAPLGDAQW